MLANGPRSVQQALLFRQLSDDVTYFTNTTSLAPHEVEQLQARSVTVVETAIDSLSVHDDHLRGVRLDDGTEVNLDAFAVMPRMVARATFLAGLGLEVVPHPSGTGNHIPVDATGRTSLPGVWAAGNVADIAAQVGASAAGGAFAAPQINADLVGEDTSASVARRPGQTLFETGPHLCCA